MHMIISLNTMDGRIILSSISYFYIENMSEPQG